MAEVCQHRADAKRLTDPSLWALSLEETHDVWLACSKPETENERDNKQRPELCEERKKNVGEAADRENRDKKLPLRNAF